MPNSGYFDTIFGAAGDLTVVPDAIQIDGSVSYGQGWGPDYELDETIPGALDISRAQTNQLFYDVTSALQKYQQHGTPDFITTSMNNGSPFSYSKGDRVIKSGVVYTSITNSNTSTPPSANWATDSFTIASNNGYAQLPSGLIIQWVHLVSITDPTTVTLPLTFPNANLWSCASYGAVPGTGSPVAPPANVTVSSTSVTTSTCIVRFSSTGGGGYGVNLLAIGY
jgi:hypothetical protein